MIPMPEQLNALLKTLGDHPTYYPILICAMLGCRRGEALGLQWQDIDFKQNVIHIRRAYIYNSLTQKNEIGELKTKNSKRALPLPEMLKIKLLKLKERNAKICDYFGVEIPYLCINDAGQLLTPNICSHHFQQAAKKVGLNGMRLHDLRHPYVKRKTKKIANPFGTGSERYSQHPVLSLDAA